MNQLTRPVNNITPFADIPTPPDPEGYNARGAERARRTLDHYRELNDHLDDKKALAALFADLMHMCDRETLEDGETGKSFFAELERAKTYYARQVGYHRKERPAGTFLEPASPSSPWAVSTSLPAPRR
jgi:hypothetical protein